MLTNYLTSLTDPEFLSILSQFKISYSFNGKVIKVSPNKITIQLKSTLKPKSFFITPQTKNKLQIILPNGQTSNQLTDIPINSTVTFTFTKDLLHKNPSYPSLPATIFTTITIKQ